MKRLFAILGLSAVVLFLADILETLCQEEDDEAPVENRDMIAVDE